MLTKVFTVLDRSTQMTLLAVQLNGEHDSRVESKALSHAGIYGDSHFILVTDLSSPLRPMPSLMDPEKWGDRTVYNAHVHIIEMWDHLSSGDVIDIRKILKEECRG